MTLDCLMCEVDWGNSLTNLNEVFGFFKNYRTAANFLSFVETPSLKSEAGFCPDGDATPIVLKLCFAKAFLFMGECFSDRLVVIVKLFPPAPAPVPEIISKFGSFIETYSNFEIRLIFSFCKWSGTVVLAWIVANYFWCSPNSADGDL